MQRLCHAGHILPAPASTGDFQGLEQTGPHQISSVCPGPRLSGQVRLVLIGLQYSHDRFLPGIVVDLYQVYCYLLRCGHSPQSIWVITDVTQDVRSTNVLNAILDGTADAEILSFISTLRLQGRVVNVNASNCRGTIQSCLVDLITQGNNLFVYYTGHGMTLKSRHPSNPLRGGCLMLDYGIWLMDDLLELQVKRCHPDQTIVWWLDCCGVGEIALPYRLARDRFRLDQVVERTAKRSAAKIMVITATSHDEKSMASSSGSVFTKSLIKILSADRTSTKGHQEPVPDGEVVGRLAPLVQQVTEDITAKKTGHRQTINVVASLPLRPVLPGWLCPSHGSDRGQTI